MVGVATVALLERKPSISRDLFTRYWRDVHGVMAARIEGFESYTQYHVIPLTPDAAPFEGIAIVTFRDEADRAGLVNGPIVPHIHRDEQNVFRRALLYNLAPGAVIGDQAPATKLPRWFLTIAGDCARPGEVIDELRTRDDVIATYDLTTGDPSGWNNTDATDGGQRQTFVSLVAGGGDFDTPLSLQLEEIGIAVYRVEEVCSMVAGGRPTPLGLRGKAALETIHEARANNQLGPEVEDAVFKLA